MICQRAIAPASKLATVRAFGQSTLADELGVADADEDDLYAAMDWLFDRQERIEDRLARRHLSDGELVLYDVSSSYFEGRCCELAALGYSRDGQARDRADHLRAVVRQAGPADRGRGVQRRAARRQDAARPDRQAQDRFGLSRVVVVSDRGMVTKANLELMRAGRRDRLDHGAQSAADPEACPLRGAAAVAVRSDQPRRDHLSGLPGRAADRVPQPARGHERARKRQDLLQATERGLAEIAQRVERGTLRGADQIGLAVGPALKRYKVKKHFQVQITDTTFTYQRKTEQIDTEAALDGIYVLRTSVPDSELSTGEVVRSYKNLEQVERAFNTFKGPGARDPPDPPPPRGPRPRARVPLHARLLPHLAPTPRLGARCSSKTNSHPVQPDPVAKATRSTAAQRKASTKHTRTGDPCHSYKSLLAELATLTRNTIRLPGTNATFHKLAQPTTLQAHALDLAEHAPLDP